MQINVSQLLKAPVGSVRNYQVSGVVDVAGGECAVQSEIRLIRTDRSILAKGVLHTEVELTCSRCLTLFDCPLTLNIEEECFPTADVNSGASLSIPEEPGCFTIDEHHVLDLTEAARQYVLLALPMKPLCQEDCAGLCPICGHNLNQGPCECLPETADSRWDELREVALAIEKETERNGVIYGSTAQTEIC